MVITIKTNTIFTGDCKEILQQFPVENIDLIYLDPPFFSNKIHEVIWHDGAEIRAFEDRWKGGINHYTSWMRERLQQCKRVLKESGSVFLHCDWHASHYLKKEMDDIFGRKNFRNEIIWHYAKQGGKTKFALPKGHEIILYYSKGNKPTFNPPKKPYSKKLLKLLKKDDKGWYYTRGSRTGRRKVAKWEKESKVGLKTYVDLEKGGTTCDTVWDDVGNYPRASESLGFPTQKPVLLLERIIKMSSNEGDIVLDPFCGCGTTLVASQKLKRKWIGIDISPTACKLMQRRLRDEFAITVKVIGSPLTIGYLKNLHHTEFQNWACLNLNGRVHKYTADMGIDGYTFDGIPIQVKQSEKVGRNVVDNFRSAIERKKKKKGVIVAFSFTSPAINEVARLELEEKISIKLIKAEDLINFIKSQRNIINDIAIQKGS